MKKIIALSLIIVTLAALFTFGTSAKDILADFGLRNDINYSSLTSETMVLMATWTKNLRSGSNRFVNDASNISLCKYGDDLKFDNSKEYPFNKFNVDVLRGYPVQVWSDASGNIVSINLAGTYSKTYRAAQITQTAENVFVADGKELPLDLAALVDNSSKFAFSDEQGIFLSANSPTGKLGINKYNDEKTTFVDVNGDGKYDFMNSTGILNAIEVIAVNDTVVQLGFSFGSPASTGWINGSNVFNYVLAEGVEALKVGDNINIALFVDCTSSTAVAANFPCRMIVTSKSTAVTGKITGIGGTSYMDLWVKIDGNKYTWTNTIEKADYADGESGVKAGRFLMNNDNIGKKVTLLLDEAGCVVRALEAGDTLATAEFDFTAVVEETTTAAPETTAAPATATASTEPSVSTSDTASLSVLYVCLALAGAAVSALAVKKIRH